MNMILSNCCKALTYKLVSDESIPGISRHIMSSKDLTLEDHLCCSACEMYGGASECPDYILCVKCQRNPTNDPTGYCRYCMSGKLKRDIGILRSDIRYVHSMLQDVTPDNIAKVRKYIEKYMTEDNIKGVNDEPANK